MASKEPFGLQFSEDGIKLGGPWKWNVWRATALVARWLLCLRARKSTRLCSEPRHLWWKVVVKFPVYCPEISWPIWLFYTLPSPISRGKCVKESNNNELSLSIKNFIFVWIWGTTSNADVLSSKRVLTVQKWNCLSLFQYFLVYCSLKFFMFLVKI